MIIDFHTHIFPEKIAERTISFLSQKGGIVPSTNGTADDLVEKMRAGSVDISVALPVVTNPNQFDSINRFAAEINARYDSIISFGGIHPLCEDIEGKMDFIKKSGFKGVKIHPDYQGEYITHTGYIKILECAKENDLIVVTHAGVDGGFRDQTVKCPPCLAKEVIKKVAGVKLVLAHLGGNEMLDTVYDTLCGEDVYFDTAYVLKHTKKEDFIKLVKKHSPDKILFATDSPWSDIKSDVEILKGFELGKDVEDKILFENARKLLN